MPRPAMFTVSLLGLLFTLQSCTAPSEADKVEAVASVIVSPTFHGGLNGSAPQRSVTATVVGTSGRLLTDRLVTWQSSLPAYLRVSGPGYQVYITRQGGSVPTSTNVTVTATCEGKTARMTAVIN